jgi:hypothetical protein
MTQILAPFIKALLPTIVLCASVMAQGRPEGLNCDLIQPPKLAGEESNHGVTLKIYPRAKDISTQYSGCQVMFAPNSKTWIVVSLTEVINGDPIRVWSDHPSNEQTANCLYRKGKIIRGDPDKCPMPEFILTKSLAPGCVKLLKSAAAKDGVTANWPKQCEYE